MTVRFRHEPIPARMAGKPMIADPTLSTEYQHQKTVDLSVQQKAILDLLVHTEGALSVREIRTRLGPQCAKRRIQKDLALLKARGLAILNGRGRGACWSGQSPMGG